MYILLLHNLPPAPWEQLEDSQEKEEGAKSSRPDGG